MIYIKDFYFPSGMAEDGYLLSFPPATEMSCYNTANPYPFRLFPKKKLKHLELEDVTILYGSNGSGKSTALNCIAEKTGIRRTAPFNRTPLFEKYIGMCHYDSAVPESIFKRNSEIVTSDDVFDFLLNIRSINETIDRRREALFDEYYQITRSNKNNEWQMKSLDDYDELVKRNEVRFKSKSQYVSRRIPREINGKSNGESAFWFFTQKIRSDALYILDEPENSLSAPLQNDLKAFIEDSARFYNCQFIISTHSPFLLSMKSAKIYNLDKSPVVQTSWTQLENVRLYYNLFQEHKDEFE